MKIDDWELIKLSLDQAEKESDRYWTRANLFIMILVGSFALVSSFFKNIDPLVMILLSLFGISISIIWFQVGRMSKFYAARWRQDAIELLKKNEEISDRMRALTNPRINRPCPQKLSSSMCVLILAIISTLLWTSLLFYSVHLYVQRTESNTSISISAGEEVKLFIEDDMSKFKCLKIERGQKGNAILYLERQR